jgi:hypothetical protein
MTSLSSVDGVIRMYMLHTVAPDAICVSLAFVCMPIADYDVSEVHRQPMTEVALRLKSMLSSGPSSGTSTVGAGEGKCYLPV